jgi:hypothetical protein
MALHSGNQGYLGLGAVRQEAVDGAHVHLRVLDALPLLDAVQSGVPFQRHHAVHVWFAVLRRRQCVLAIRQQLRQSRGAVGVGAVEMGSPDHYYMKVTWGSGRGGS